VVGGYLTVALGTILTFNVLVGQVTVDSGSLQLILGTIGAALSGLAGGLVAGIVAPRFPLAHVAGVLIFLIIDTASVVAKGPGPLWFDLAGSSVLAITVLIGGWIIASRRESEMAPRPAV
jgi:MFS-type transporter involved in bile tolerance (Atg22 family)